MRSAAMILLPILLLPTPLPAQEKPSESTAVIDGSRVEVQFGDGSLVKMMLLDDKIEVTTRYGKLAVPITEVRRIEFGLRYPEGTLAKIEEAIRRLGDPDFKKRESASAELLAFRELAYPHLRRAIAADGNAEAVKRARTLVDQLRERLPEEKLAIKELDLVTTADFPIAGRVEAATLKGRSPLLGEMEVKLEQVRSIRWQGAATEVAVTVDGARFGPNPQFWQDSGVDLSGDKVVMQASGTVDVMPQNPGRFLANPDGLRAEIGVRGGQQLVGPPGALIGRIGTSGRPFLIGSRFEGTPGEGRLYLKIESSPWQIPMQGTFNVKVITGQ